MYRKLYLNKSNSNPPTAAYILPVQLIENLYKAGVEPFHEQPIAHICVPLTGKPLFIQENCKTTKYFGYWTTLIKRKLTPSFSTGGEGPSVQQKCDSSIARSTTYI